MKLPDDDNYDQNGDSDRKIVTTAIENIKIIQDDIQSALTLINNLVVINKNHKNLNYLNGTAILVLDSNSQIYYYNLDNLEIIFSDMKLNQFCWKAIHNSYLLNKLNKKNSINSVSVSLSDTSFPLFCQRISSIYGPINIVHSKFYSLFDYKIRNLLTYLLN